MRVLWAGGIGVRWAVRGLLKTATFFSRGTNVLISVQRPSERRKIAQRETPFLSCSGETVLLYRKHSVSTIEELRVCVFWKHMFFYVRPQSSSSFGSTLLSVILVHKSTIERSRTSTLFCL